MSTVLTGRPQWPIVTAVLLAAGLGALGEYQLDYDNRPSGPAIAKALPGPQPPPKATRPSPPDPAVTSWRAETVPPAGTGDFAVAGGAGQQLGSGFYPIRIQIVVELVETAQRTQGAPVLQPAGGITAEAFATSVEATLSDPRSWTASGNWSFIRVDTAPDLVIRLATPATTDQRCAGYGLSTAGEVSCQGGSEIMINLKRWLLAVPWYAGALTDYRHMVINHEVGHFLGFGHVECSGAGNLAAVMQTQTYGLGDCSRNPWPFPDGQSYLG